MKKIGLFLVGMTVLGVFTGRAQGTFKTIPLGGNAFCNRGTDERGGGISEAGIVKWSDSGVSFAVYFRVMHPGTLQVLLNAAIPEGTSQLRVSLTGVAGTKDLMLSGVIEQSYDAGTWQVHDTGYQYLKIEGVGKTGRYFANISNIEVEGENLAYVPNNEGNFFHWGRRGPSVHLNYALEDTVHAEWFYNEVTVPVGQDIEGSYFMADGFGQGYFGMQVNSPTERHILFSVWSPFETDNPASVPDSQRIILMKQGEEVHAGEFGNEGSGGQSWLNYLWRAGNTYRFLLRGKPIEFGYTQFTAWFFAPEEGKWRLIASFSRPQTHAWLTRLHSFLENFEPEQGDRQREVSFRNQWIRTEAGKWMSIGRARFTGDNTARKGYRMDYGGGVKGDAFYLTNCGFFNTYTAMDSWLEKAVTTAGQAPDIDFRKLP